MVPKWVIGVSSLEKGMIYIERKVWMLGAKQINVQELFDAYAYLLSSFALVEDTSKFIQRGIQFSSVAQSCQTLCDPINCSMPGLPVHHQLPESTQTHVHRVNDTIQPSHPLSSPSPPALNLAQHRGLFRWVNASHQVAKVLEFQLQHQSFQWTPRTDLL